MAEKFFLNSLNGTDNDEQNCICLPSCTSINYDVVISSAKFDFQKYFRAPPQVNTYCRPNETGFGSLNLYFTENQFITSKRSELYGFTQFLGKISSLENKYTKKTKNQMNFDCGLAYYQSIYRQFYASC